MTLRLHPDPFCICRLYDTNDVDLSRPYTFFANTGSERSLVCRRDDAPQNPEKRETGWRLLRVEGTLDFSLVGILSGLTTALADAGVGLFAVSTFDTDYLLVRENRLEDAVAALQNAGHSVLPY